MKIIFNADKQSIQNTNIEWIFNNLEEKNVSKDLFELEKSISNLPEKELDELNRILSSKTQKKSKLKKFFSKNGVKIGTTLFNGIIDLIK